MILERDLFAGRQTKMWKRFIIGLFAFLFLLYGGQWLPLSASGKSLLVRIRVHGTLILGSVYVWLQVLPVLNYHISHAAGNMAARLVIFTGLLLAHSGFFLPACTSKIGSSWFCIFCYVCFGVDLQLMCCLFCAHCITKLWHLCARLIGICDRKLDNPLPTIVCRQSDALRDSTSGTTSGFARFYVAAGCAAVLSIYGLYCAAQPPVVNIVDIPMKDLPPAFDRISIAHVSDVHIGPVVTRSQVEHIVAIVGNLNPGLCAGATRMYESFFILKEMKEHRWEKFSYQQFLLSESIKLD